MLLIQDCRRCGDRTRRQADRRAAPPPRGADRTRNGARRRSAGPGTTVSPLQGHPGHVPSVRPVPDRRSPLRRRTGQERAGDRPGRSCSAGKAHRVCARPDQDAVPGPRRGGEGVRHDSGTARTATATEDDHELHRMRPYHTATAPAMQLTCPGRRSAPGRGRLPAEDLLLPGPLRRAVEDDQMDLAGERRSRSVTHAARRRTRRCGCGNAAGPRPRPPPAKLTVIVVPVRERGRSAPPPPPAGTSRARSVQPPATAPARMLCRP